MVKAKRLRLATRKQVELTIHLQNTKPVELVDLGMSLQALGRHYEEFVYAKGYDQQAGNAHLYIAELRSGSIIAKLQALLHQGSFIIDHIQVLAGFMTNLNELIEFFRTPATTKREDIGKDEAERLSKMVEPVAKDGGAQMTFNITGNTAPVIVNNIIVTSERANAVQNNVRRFLGKALPSQDGFQNELLYLHQMQGDPRSKAGDRGVIEKFSSKPVKLLFMTPEVKAAIVDMPENPFKMAYVVDGQISTVEGQPALYKVATVRESLERPGS